MNRNIIPVLAIATLICFTAMSDSCTNYMTLSDPWRNIGFMISLHTPQPMSDIHLKGWYRFTGIGGDRLLINDNFFKSGTNESCTTFDIHSCKTNISSTVKDCSTTDQIVLRLDCGAGLFLYQLEPSNGTYITRHSSCSASSCGENAECNQTIGSCTCVPGLKIPDGLLPQGDSYGCTDFKITEPKTCQVNFTLDCLENLLNQTQNSTTQVMPQQTMVKILTMILNSTSLLETASPTQLAYYGNSILKASEKLVSALVNNMQADTNYSTSINLSTLEIQIFGVGPNTTLTKIPQLKTKDASLDIDLIEIAKENHGKAAVVFMSYSNMSSMLKPQTNVTVMSTVVTVMLQQLQTDTRATSTNQQGFNFTMKNSADSHNHLKPTCMKWGDTKWTEGCNIISKNDSHTTCSSIRPGTFAILININAESDSNEELLNVILESVGLGFLSLALVTLALFHGNMRMTSVALINLCMSLLLAHLLFLLTRKFLEYIQPKEMLCKVTAGALHFLFLSSFVWMFIEGVLLFIAVKNLSKIRSKPKDMLNWKCMIIIGYVVPLVIVGVSAGLFPDGYGSDQCWLSKEKDFFWSFVGPVCFILTLNGILFITIVVIIACTLKKQNNKILQSNYRTANELVKSVMLKTLAQFSILGCPWILGFFTSSSKVVEILFLVLNSQQGTFIFLVHCVLNQEIRQKYRKCLGRLCLSTKPATKPDVPIRPQKAPPPRGK